MNEGCMGYLGLFIFFMILFTRLREIGYISALKYVECEKTKSEAEMKKHSLSENYSSDYFSFLLFSSEKAKIDRLKSRVDRNIISSKFSCVGIIIVSLLGIIQAAFLDLIDIQNTIDYTLILFNVLFWVFTTSIPKISEVLPKR